MRTYWPKKEEVVHKWYHVDAEGKILGRLAVKIARVLMGKHKPIFSPHVDTGDFVVVTNADMVKVRGRKLTQRLYWRYAPHHSSLKSQSMAEILASSKPERVLYLAVKRMLPKRVLGRQMLRKLKVYAGPDNPHAAQKLEKLDAAVR
jgi:large subunit ribosomal protein L13